MQQLNASPFDGRLRSAPSKVPITVLGVIMTSIALLFVVSSSLITNIPAFLIINQVKSGTLPSRVVLNQPNSTSITPNELLPNPEARNTPETSDLIAFREDPTVSVEKKSQLIGFTRSSAQIIWRVLDTIRSIFIALFSKLRGLRIPLISSASSASTRPFDSLTFNPNPFRVSRGVINDHLETDINLLPITPEQRETLLATFTQIIEAVKANPEVYGSRPVITPHGVYRYYAASDWQPLYNGRSYLDSILATLQYRHSERLDDRPSYFASSISSTQSLSSSSSLVYVSPAADKQQRAVLYLKVSRYDTNAAKSPASAAEMIRMVALAVER